MQRGAALTEQMADEEALVCEPLIEDHPYVANANGQGEFELVEDQLEEHPYDDLRRGEEPLGENLPCGSYPGD